MNKIALLALNCWVLFSCSIMSAQELGDDRRWQSASIVLDGNTIFTANFLTPIGRADHDATWINFASNIGGGFKPTDSFDRSLFKQESSGWSVLESEETGPAEGRLQITGDGIGDVWLKKIRLKKIVGNKFGASTGWVIDHRSLRTDPQALRFIPRNRVFQIANSGIPRLYASGKAIPKDPSDLGKQRRGHKVILRHGRNSLLVGNYETQKIDPDEIWKGFVEALKSKEIEFSALAENAEAELDHENGFAIRTKDSPTIYLEDVGSARFVDQVTLSASEPGKYCLASFKISPNWTILRTAIPKLKNQGKKFAVSCGMSTSGEFVCVKTYELGHGDVQYSAIFKYDEHNGTLKHVHQVSGNFEQLAHFSKYRSEKSRYQYGWRSQPTNCGRFLINTYLLVEHHSGKSGFSDKCVTLIFDTQNKKAYPFFGRDFFSTDELDKLKRLNRSFWFTNTSDDHENHQYAILYAGDEEVQFYSIVFDLEKMHASRSEKPHPAWIEGNVAQYPRAQWTCGSADILDGVTPPKKLIHGLAEGKEPGPAETFLYDSATGNYVRKGNDHVED